MFFLFIFLVVYLIDVKENDILIIVIEKSFIEEFICYFEDNVLFFVIS